MSARLGLFLSLTALWLAACFVSSPSSACCPAPPSGKAVVNADQTVIILWDAASKTQHFIRQASFIRQADDFGFLVPSPTQPELDESGNDAFPFLRQLTAPEIHKIPRPTGISCGCSASPSGAVVKSAVKVLKEQSVAGFKAVVLEAQSADALVDWLRENGYAFSPEVAAWAKPYIDAGWIITALKVAADVQGTQSTSVAAPALRMTFKTDQPLFPYREPNSASPAEALGAAKRLLRIYFLAEARYKGELTEDVTWTGQVAWSNKLTPANRKEVLELLKLPENTVPAECWLTEFEDPWPYQVAPADVRFSRGRHQKAVERPPIVEYVYSPWSTDVVVLCIALLPLIRRVGRKRNA